MLFSNPYTRGSTGFRVPDAEVESASDKSREASLQIIDSHPCTYSVPSSDDETDEDGEDDEEINETSPGTTLEQLARQHKTPRDYVAASSFDDGECGAIASEAQSTRISNPGHIPEEKIGTSQFNPIDLEVQSKRNANTLRIESDDEGPDILPISQPYLDPFYRAPSTNSFNDSKPESSSFRVPVMPFLLFQNRQNSPVFSTKNDFAGKDVTGTPTGFPRVRTPSSYLRGPIDDTEDDFDSADEDDDYDYENDNDEEFLAEERVPKEPVTPNEASQRHNSVIKFTAPKSHISITTGESSFPEKFVHDPMVSSSGGLNVSQDYVRNDLTAAQRPPSPSDAALAKKADSNLRSLSTDEFPKDSSSAHLNGFGKQHEVAPKGGWAQPSLHYPIPSDPSAQIMFNGLETDNSRYEDGPFASQSKMNQLPHPLPNLSKELWHPSMVPSPVQSELFFSENSPIPRSFVRKSNFRMATTAMTLSDTTADEITRISRENSLQRVNEGQPSKVNISNLVNSYADIARNLKRKADDISTDSQHTEPVDIDSQVTPSQDLKSQDFILPDAQARDFPAVEVQVSQESSAAIVLDDLSSRAIGLPSTGSPARKKIKTSKSKALGVGKFVSGVLVGVAGALTAFLATIPMSVREEALREFQSAS